METMVPCNLELKLVWANGPLLIKVKSKIPQNLVLISPIRILPRLPSLGSLSSDAARLLKEYFIVLVSPSGQQKCPIARKDIPESNQPPLSFRLTVATFPSIRTWPWPLLGQIGVTPTQQTTIKSTATVTFNFALSMHISSNKGPRPSSRQVRPKQSPTTSLTGPMSDYLLCSVLIGSTWSSPRVGTQTLTEIITSSKRHMTRAIVAKRRLKRPTQQVGTVLLVSPQAAQSLLSNVHRKQSKQLANAFNAAST